MLPKWSHCETGEYRNHMNESIMLTVEHLHDDNLVGEDTLPRQCKISIRRTELGLRWFFARLAIYSSVAQLALVTLCLVNHMQIRLIWSICLLVFIVLLMYILAPAIEESIILFANLDGIECERRSLLGRHSSTFINTNKIIINEAITMQRVIFYLVAIPLCLQPLILRNNDDHQNNSNSNKVQSNCQMDESYKNKLVAETKLIPLFMSTLPRLDCLKVIYSYVAQFDQRQQQQQFEN